MGEGQRTLEGEAEKRKSINVKEGGSRTEDKNKNGMERVEDTTKESML